MSSHMLSQCHDPNQPHILGPIITDSLTDNGSLWPCDQRAHWLATCHREGEVHVFSEGKPCLVACGISVFQPGTEPRPGSESSEFEPLYCQGLAPYVVFLNPI